MTVDLREQLQQALAEAYMIERELGGGGMARVFLAEDRELGRQVVVKVLSPELAAGISAERFAREIRLAARLQQANIVPVLSAGRLGTLAYYTMPYVPGDSLRARLGGGALPIGEAISILRDVARALAYAHAQGVVHRDVKPENVLLSGGTAVVTDFGIAKAISASKGDATETLTQLGAALGTPAYMAPEQASGDDVDHRADLYSWGVLAYELLLGTHPFSDKGTAQALIAAHLVEQPAPLAAKRADCPAPLAQLVMRCLEKDAARRPQSAEELLVCLEAAGMPRDGMRTPVVLQRARAAERTFRLSEGVCRQLDRTTLDPRMIGDSLHYLDNEIASDVLVCCLHGCGLDQDNFREVLESLPYRAVAPTLYGFEMKARRRLSLPLESHLVLLREFLFAVSREARPTTVVLVGFSSGADVAFRLLSRTGSEALGIQGLLALGCNLSLETCFVSRLFARVRPENDESLLADLRHFAVGAQSVGEWLNIHEYLVRVLRKFHRHMEVLRLHSSELVRPFESRGDAVFIEWFRAAAARVRAVRCVFEESETNSRLVQALRLRNLDEGILGEHYREDSLVLEPDIDHFELLAPERFQRHLDAVLAGARE